MQPLPVLQLINLSIDAFNRKSLNNQEMNEISFNNGTWERKSTPKYCKHFLVPLLELSLI
jgi:hypothetical protein